MNFVIVNRTNMRKKLVQFLEIILLGLSLSVRGSFAQSLDTLGVSRIATGVEHYLIRWQSVPLTVNLIKVNLDERGVSLRVVKASKNSREILAAREKTSEMIKDADNDSTLAVAAINGGFFNMKSSRPINLDIENGMIVRLPGTKGRISSLLITSNNKAMIGRFELSVALAVSDTTFHIDDFNDVSGFDQTILFDRFYGRETATQFHGAGVVLTPISRSRIGDVLKCVVDTLIQSSRHFAIPPSGYVLVSRGHARVATLRRFSIHDTVQLLTQFKPEVDGVTQALGGLPMIVHDGKNVAEAEAAREKVNAALADEHHPRTAIGISRDGKKVFLVVVDGRTKASVGMTLSELADMMIKLDAYDAVNMDGGGSSTMIVKGKIVNSPSDPAGERAVSNALVVTVRK